MMKKQIKIMLSAMIAASLAGGAASAAELFPKSGDFPVNQNTDYVTQGKVAGNVSITGSNARPNVSVSDQADHASTETDHGILFADGGHTVSLKDLGTLDINSAKGTDDPVVGIYSAGGAVINVTNVDKVNIGTSDAPFKTYSYALMTLGGDINIGTETEKVGDVNIFTTATGICAQTNGGSGTKYSAKINSDGNVTIHTNDAPIQAMALNKGVVDGAGVFIDAEGKVLLQSDNSEAMQIMNTATNGITTWNGDGNIDVSVNGDAGVNIESGAKNAAIYMSRAPADKSDSASSLTIESSKGDVTISGGTRGIYMVTPSNENSELGQMKGHVRGNNVTIHSGTESVYLSKNSNLSLAVNQNGGQINLDSENGNAVSITGSDSRLTLGDGNYKTDVNINGYVNVTGADSQLNFGKDTTIHVDGKYLENADKAFITTKNSEGTQNGSVSLGENSQFVINHVRTGTLNFSDNTVANDSFEQLIKAGDVSTDNLLQQVTFEEGKGITVGMVDKAQVSELLEGTVLQNVAYYATQNNNDGIKALVESDNPVEALNSAAGLAAMANTAHGTYTMNGIFSDAVSGHLMNRQDQDVWAYGFHSKENVNGLSFGADYDAQYNGIAAGADFYKKGGTTAGLALIYADSNVSGANGVSSTKNDADYYGVSLYSRFDRGSYALLGDISYMKGDHDITQVNSGETITASPDSDSISVGVKAVKDYAAGENGTLTPYVGLRYLRLSTDDFTASNGLRYEGDDQDLVIVPVGVNYTASISHGKWSVRPYAGIGYVWTAGDRSADQTVMLGTAADSFSYDTADSGSFIARAGVTTDCGDMSYGIGYSWQKGDSVSNNAWTVSASYHF